MMRMRLNGQEIHYVDSGAGRPLVLVHFLGGSVFFWRPLIDHTNRHFGVCALDLPGFGESIPPPDNDYSISAMADHVVALARDLRLQDAVLVCHSFGGKTGIRALLRDSSRFTGLVLIDTAVGDARFRPGFHALAVRGLGEGLMSLVNRRETQRVMKSIYSGDHVITEEEIEQFMLPFQTRERRRAYSAYLRDFLGEGGRLTSELNGIAVPTLILWGARDRFLAPAHGKMLNDRIQDSKLEIIAGCGHSPHEEQPERVARTIIEKFGAP